MTDQVLMDVEIERIGETVKGSCDWRPLARAVEQAVSAKVSNTYIIVRDGKYIATWNNTEITTEREARKRERAAYTRGYLQGRRGDTSTVNEWFPLPSCDKCGQVLP